MSPGRNLNNLSTYIGTTEITFIVVQTRPKHRSYILTTKSDCTELELNFLKDHPSSNNLITWKAIIFPKKAGTPRLDRTVIPLKAGDLTTNRWEKL